jgi:hypothetical protein
MIKVLKVNGLQCFRVTTEWFLGIRLPLTSQILPKLFKGKTLPVPNEGTEYALAFAIRHQQKRPHPSAGAAALRTTFFRFLDL